jgi:SagB-type dehydrogenase family enzyme
MRRILLSIVLLFVICCSHLIAQDIALPSPVTTGGKPLMEALKDRKTSRSFSTQPLEPQMIANLLWAAYGINRPESGKRTAPSAVNYQETDLYVCLSTGVYLYDAKNNLLKMVIPQDLRAKMGKQDFVAEAPLVLVYVADFDKMGKSSEKDKENYAGIDVGYISQNVYLFCASENLATVVLGWIDKEAMSGDLKLSSAQHVILSQPVGYPGKE